jgi:hypothetical protein
MPPATGNRPDNSLPGRPIKPPGFPVLPVDPDWDIPEGPPSWLGDWVPVDPGFGQPPIFGFLPVDPGFDIPEKPEGPPGHWLPVDPEFGRPSVPGGGGGCDCNEPKWVWVPEIGPDFGWREKKAKEPKPSKK